jgi:hypothetical protein
VSPDYKSNHLPTEFELPFEFHGDPVMNCHLNGEAVDRCVLDTGAPATVIRCPEHFSTGGETLDDGSLIVSSLVVNSVEFGPLRVRAKRVSGLTKPEIFLGTTLFGSHCLEMDYKHRIARFSSRPFYDGNSGEFSEISFSRGRPTISIKIHNSVLVFVLDTGSNANWLFFRAQEESLLDAGVIADEDSKATCGLGDIEVRRSLTLPSLAIGGVDLPQVKFLLASERDFGGPSMTVEDGIIGTGQLCELYAGTQVIDFISKRFYLR